MTIQTLNLNFETQTASADGNLANALSGFQEGLFAEESSIKRTIFDWAFGAIVPLICVAADPIVFRHDGDLLAAYRPFAYLLSFISILAMAAWLLWGPKLKWLAAPVSGLFYVGGAISLLVGLVLLPFSIFGIMFSPISLLGLTPLFSAVVYIRHGRRAYNASLLTLEDPTAWRAAFLAGLFSFVIPYVINVQIVRAVNEISTGDVNTIRRETAKLKFVAPLADLGPVLKLHRRFEVAEKESPRAQEFANAYREIRGLEIEDGPYGWD
jgi:hypothetical protein